MTANGPPPTTLVFLNDLSSLRPGSKVRFLGCVAKYHVKTGVLALRHAYPPPPQPGVVALVDVTLLLSTLTLTDTQVGEWVNVIGYVAAGENSRAGNGREAQGRDEDGRVFVRMQAVMLWSAGSVRIGEYERVLTERQRVQKELNDDHQH